MAHDTFPLFASFRTMLPDWKFDKMHAQALHSGPTGTYCMVHNNFTRTEQKKLRAFSQWLNEAGLIK